MAVQSIRNEFCSIYLATVNNRLSLILHFNHISAFHIGIKMYSNARGLMAKAVTVAFLCSRRQCNEICQYYLKDPNKRHRANCSPSSPSFHSSSRPSPWFLGLISLVGASESRWADYTARDQASCHSPSDPCAPVMWPAGMDRRHVTLSLGRKRRGGWRNELMQLFFASCFKLGAHIAIETGLILIT